MNRFLEQVPTDWDQMMPGFQPWDDTPERINNDVVRIRGSNRTHFYIIRDRPGFDMRRELYLHWITNASHCDHLMSQLQKRFQCYAPRIQIVGQRASFSDIEGRDHEDRFWIMGGDRRPILILHCPESVISQLNNLMIHRPLELGARVLGSEITKLQSEAIAQGKVLTIVHPDAWVSTVSKCTADPLYSVVGATLEEVKERLPNDVRLAMGENVV